MSISPTTRGGAFTARGGWLSDKVYFQDDIVIWPLIGGIEYQSLLPVNQGNQPDISPFAWIPAPGGTGNLVLGGGNPALFADFATGAAQGVPVKLTDVPSNTQFDLVNIGQPGSMVYDWLGNALAPMTRSVKIGTTSSKVAFMQFNSFGRFTDTNWGRLYFFFSGNVSQNWQLVRWQSGGVGIGSLILTAGANPKLQGWDNTNTSHGTTTPLTANQWYRLEWSMTRDAANGVLTLFLYLGHSLVASQTIVCSPFNTGTFLDVVQFGSVNNSNLGNPVWIGGFADMGESAIGRYVAPPPNILSAVSPVDGLRYGGWDANGELSGYIQTPTYKNGSLYKLSRGQQAFRLTKQGVLLAGGPNVMADWSIPDNVQSIPDIALDPQTGRIIGRSYEGLEVNDPPDMTFTRVGSANNDRTGTDGSVNGAVFTSNNIGFTSLDLHKALDVSLDGGAHYTRYIISSVDSNSQVHLEDTSGNPANFAPAAGLFWTTSAYPYPALIQGVGSQVPLGQVRSQPFIAAFNRAGNDGQTFGTNNFQSAIAAFTSADQGRVIMLGNDPTRIYTILAVGSATSITLSAADPTSTTNVPWAICNNAAEDGAFKAGWNPHTLTMYSEPGIQPAHLDANGAVNYGPAAWVFAVAMNKLYAHGAGGDAVMNLRADGRVEIFNRLTLSDPASNTLTSNLTDTQIWRSAASREFHNALIDATTLGVATKQKAGAPVDSDWAAAPPNAILVVDSTNNKLWARVGGVWKGVVLA